MTTRDEGTEPLDYRDPALVGVLRPVTRELTAVDLPVEGAIPPELDGLYLRNSFNAHPASKRRHLYLADGMVHGVRIKNGTAAWYRNRWVVTDALAAAAGLPSPRGPSDRCWAPSNPANTHVIAHGGRILALCEVGLPHELSDDLETLGRFDFAGQLTTSMTAHPRTDPETGALHFFAYGPRAPYVHYYRADRQNRIERRTTIDVRGPTVMHDFIITQNFAVFLDLPLLVDPSRSAGGLPFRWDPAYGARIGLMPLHAQTPCTRWVDIAPCFIPHIMNAFERGRELVLRAFMRDGRYITGEAPPTEDAISLEEWRVNLDTGNVSQIRISDRRCDLPRIDERRIGRPHRFGYAMEVPGDATWPVRGALFKYDFAMGTAEEHDFGPRAKAAEPVFVPGGQGEDEGWLLSFVYDDVHDVSYLAVMDAQAFIARPLAMIALPQRVPYGAHGSWIAMAP